MGNGFAGYGAGNASVQSQGYPGAVVPPTPQTTFQSRLTDILIRLQDLDVGLDGFHNAIVNGPSVKQNQEPNRPVALAAVIDEIDQTVHRIKNTTENIVRTIGV